MKPSEIEDHYIRKIELNRRLQEQEAEQQAAAEMEKFQLKQLHWMHCPKCGQELIKESYGPVEIDHCPSCRGLWLDANELETIVASESKRGLFQSCLQVLSRR